jgi:hypothetical protein
VCAALGLAAALLSGLTGCERLLTTPSLYGSVAVTVTRRNGAPVPGARLLIYTGQRPMGYGTTDSLGRYLFEDVPEGLYGVRAYPPTGYERVERFLPTSKPSDVVDGLQLTAGAQRTASFTFLQVGPGTIEAVVREAGGSPIPGLTTILYSPTGELRRGTTDPGGRLLFPNVPFGLYGVTVERPALYRDSGEVALPYMDGLVVEAGGNAQATFAFEKCQGTITAQLVDQSRRPVPGGQLVFYSGATVLSRDTVPVADATRRYGPLLCADYGLRAVLPRGYTATNVRGSAYVDGLRVRRNSQLQALLQVQRIARATVVVSIRDQGERPVPDARVVLYNSSGLVRDQGTDSTGRAVMDTVLMSELHGVRIVNPRGYLLGEGRGISYLDQLLLADGEVREIPFRMERTGRATVQVQITDQDNRPVPAARVVLYTGAGVERDLRTGSDGTITLGNLIVALAEGPLDYGVRVVAPAGYTVEEGRGLTYQDGLRLTDGELRRLPFRFRRLAP